MRPLAAATPAPLSSNIHATLAGRKAGRDKDEAEEWAGPTPGWGVGEPGFWFRSEMKRHALLRSLLHRGASSSSRLPAREGRLAPLSAIYADPLPPATAQNSQPSPTRTWASRDPESSGGGRAGRWAGAAAPSGGDDLKEGWARRLGVEWPAEVAPSRPRGGGPGKARPRPGRPRGQSGRGGGGGGRGQARRSARSCRTAVVSQAGAATHCALYLDDDGVHREVRHVGGGVVLSSETSQTGAPGGATTPPSRGRAACSAARSGRRDGGVGLMGGVAARCAPFRPKARATLPQPAFPFRGGVAPRSGA